MKGSNANVSGGAVEWSMVDVRGEEVVDAGRGGPLLWTGSWLLASGFEFWAPGSSTSKLRGRETGRVTPMGARREKRPDGMRGETREGRKSKPGVGPGEGGAAGRKPKVFRYGAARPCPPDDQVPR